MRSPRVFIGLLAVLLVSLPPKAGANKDLTAGWKMEQRSYAAGAKSIVGVVDTPGGVAEVQVLQGGRPAAGVAVEFRLVGAPPQAKGAKLDKTRVLTDKNGRARVRVRLGDRSGDYLVAAYLRGSVTGHPAVVTRFRALSSTWIILLVIGLLGGLGLFLFGMSMAGDNLQKAAGDRMRVWIGTLARNRFSGVALGTVASGVLQSSSATTVMLVGFVSATMMSLTQAISVTMGAKIGTTITVQLIAFKISKYSLALVAAGVLMTMAAGRRKKIKALGNILTGFGLLFFGLSLMSEAMRPLRGMPALTDLMLRVGSSDILAILIGTAFTAIIQSSAATIALCMALATQGLLPLSAAIPISIGAAIGTCATALLASLGASRDGKRVALAHLIYSVLAALIFLPLLPWFVALTKMFTGAMGSTSVTREIANGFMLFAVLAAAVFLPFVGLLEALVRWLVPTLKAERPFGPKYINEAALTVPVLALEQAHQEVTRLAELLHKNLEETMPAIEKADDAEMERLIAEDDKIDILERAIRPFLAQVAQTELSEKSSARERGLIYITEHLEAAGDYLAKEVLHTGVRMTEAGSAFSSEGIEELKRFHEKILAKSELVVRAIRDSDRHLAEQVVQLTFKEAQLERRLRDSHLGRLQSGAEKTVQSSRAHLTVLNGLRGIGAKLEDVAQEILREL